MVQQKNDQDCGRMEDGELDEIRVLLVGDPGSGKTSLIHTLVHGEFCSNVPARMSDVCIPAKMTTEDLPLHIVDYSSREQNADCLKMAISSSHIICIVYDASIHNSLDRVTNHWIPEIYTLQENPAGPNKPLIVAANKIDLMMEQEKHLLNGMSFSLQEFNDVETHIATSALTKKNVLELFAAAQKAVIFPLAPLFDPRLRILTRKCQIALIDIFKVSDLDGDGLLNDHEMDVFHENCFGVPLQRSALDDLKSVIKQSIMGGVIDNGITEAGFLFIHTLSIDKGRRSFTWKVLKKFNYNNKIDLVSTCPPEMEENLNPPTSDEAAEELLSSIEKSIGQLDASSVSGDEQNDEHSSITPREISKSSATLKRSNNNSDRSRALLKSQIDPSWLSGHANITTGLGFTFATFVSMLALKYFVKNTVRNFG